MHPVRFPLISPIDSGGSSASATTYSPQSSISSFSAYSAADTLTSEDSSQAAGSRHHRYAPSTAARGDNRTNNNAAMDVDETAARTNPSTGHNSSHYCRPQSHQSNATTVSTEEPSPQSIADTYSSPSFVGSSEYFPSPVHHSEASAAGGVPRAIVKSSNGRTPLAIVQPANGQPAAAAAAASAGRPSPSKGDLTHDEKLRQLDSMSRIPIDNALALTDHRQSFEMQYSGDDNFNRLSDEMVLAVFQHLPKKALFRCSLVCRRFYNVVSDESLWQRLELGNRTLRAGGLGRILVRGVVILRLAQSKITAPIFDWDTLGGIPSSRLQYLDLSMADVSAPALAQLLSCCRQLKKLSLEHVPVDQAICMQIGLNVGMEVLNLTMCDGLEAAGLSLMLTALHKLHTLNVSWTGLDATAVKVVVSYVPKRLMRLNVAGCRKSMTDRMLQRLVERCVDLVELDLSDCSSLTENAIESVSTLPKLEYLSLSRCYNIAGSAYLTLSQMRSLTFLDIFGVLSDQALQMMQKSYPGIVLNRFVHSSVGRPTVGSRRTSIWGQRTRDL